MEYGLRRLATASERIRLVEINRANYNFVYHPIFLLELAANNYTFAK